ncbi:MAG: hypothetical protein GEU90_14845 [Gemmatimonas sp.]|nr:hypothetical protein [Gemmatimonas sp.]
MTTKDSVVRARRLPATEDLTDDDFAGSFWIGKHSADQDLLVFDPNAVDADGEIIALYSLTQHRARSFRRSTLIERIRIITDAEEHARAKEDYEKRDLLRATHEQELEAARAERLERQRAAVVGAHRRYLEALELPYDGVRETDADHRPGRRTKCHSCGIALDDFARAVCVTCDGVLCSCGACACGRAPRR